MMQFSSNSANAGGATSAHVVTPDLEEPAKPHTAAQMTPPTPATTAQRQKPRLARFGGPCHVALRAACSVTSCCIPSYIHTRVSTDCSLQVNNCSNV